MALTQFQKTIVATAKTVGGGHQGIALSDEACAYLVAVIVRDLDLHEQFRELPSEPMPFFGAQPLAELILSEHSFLPLFERLLAAAQDADTYFHCLATLHKARLKYERILQTQPVPTIDQVGPRCLLQYGKLTPKALAGFLLWRKWIYDIDNRAAQETGYVFEPIIAASIGGVPVSAAKSPVRRLNEGSKGRQVDCVLPEKKDYEIKVRVTIAASGQGRWREELEFPADCKSSGFVPVLVVLDPTTNPKLEELRRRFLDQGGEAYIGDHAWSHFRDLAGPTMSRFLEKYVHEPIQSLLEHVPKNLEELPDLVLQMGASELTLSLAEESLTIKRQPQPSEASGPDELPEDVDEQALEP